MKKPAAPKKLSYRLIEPESPAGRTLYPLVAELVDQHHHELTDARIALAWNLSWKADVDGRVTLGKCKKASELDRELAAFDFVIILRQAFFEDSRVTDLQRRALLDHELCHAQVKYDESGEKVVDEKGRTVYRTRKHDLEEFAEIADRYGCWKKDIEAFATAIERARARVSQWVGYTGLKELLASVGAPIALEVIQGWTAAERREAELWALVQLELKKLHVEPGVLADASTPEHVRAALVAQEAPVPIPVTR